jgi:aryl-alcohol dehydrogenase
MEIQAAIVREKHGRFSLETVELAEPDKDEVLVKIVATGICHTDLAVRDQHIPLPLPAVLGHEGAGIVVAVGDNVSNVRVGAHVVLSYGSCGECANCLAGKPAYCAAFLVYNFNTRRPDGTCTHHQKGHPLTSAFFYQSSFATHAITHHRNVVTVDSDLPLEILAPLGCGIQTGAGAVMNCLKPRPGSSIAIFGMGAVGLSAVMAAAISGCTAIIAVDVQDSRLDLARQLGATHIINSKKVDAVATVKEISKGGTDYAVEATGIPAVMTQAFDGLNSTGIEIVLGVAPAGSFLHVDASALLGGKTVRGVIEGESVPSIFIPRLIALWQAGKFPFDKLERVYPLAQINEAVRDSETGVTIKAVLKM